MISIFYTKSGNKRLIGHNAARLALGMPLLILPSSIDIGDIVSCENVRAMSRDERSPTGELGFFLFILKRSQFKQMIL